MPPLLFFVLETPFTKLAHAIFPTAVANGIIAGAFTFYVFYDCFHYAFVSSPSSWMLFLGTNGCWV